jgi:hypothetical protein
MDQSLVNGALAVLGALFGETMGKVGQELSNAASTAVA